MVTTKADTTGSSTARPRSKAAINRMTKMPMVAACAAPRQIGRTAAGGCGSATGGGGRGLAIIGFFRGALLPRVGTMHDAITGEPENGCPGACSGP